MSDENIGDPIQEAEGVLRRQGRRTQSARELPRLEGREAARGEPRAARGPLQRTRRRNSDRFYVNPALIPPGMSWEWKRKSCFGAVDSQYLSELEENHWKPVSQEEYPSLITEQGGQILMERPLYLTQEAREEDYQFAREQVSVSQGNARSTPAGTMTRDHPSVRANTMFNKTVEPMSVPKE